MKIEEAIQQEKFTSEYHKLHINLLFTTAWLNQRTAQVLKPYNISWQQFNILRILKGMHPEPATIKLLTERMIDKMSNASRLVEKLRVKGYIERVECQADRRRVDIKITDLGLQLLEETSIQLDKTLEGYNSKLTEEEAAIVNSILDKMRNC